MLEDPLRSTSGPLQVHFRSTSNQLSVNFRSTSSQLLVYLGPEVITWTALAGFVQKIHNKKMGMCQFWIHNLITKRFGRKSCISLTVVFFAKLEICIFIATSCNLDSVVICDFCVRNYVIISNECKIDTSLSFYCGFFE